MFCPDGRRIMPDDKTHKLPSPAQSSPQNSFLTRHRVSLVVVQGVEPRTKIGLRRARTVFGRGGEADVVVPDETMSREHFALEAGPDGVRLIDLGSTNGILLNGKPVKAFELGHGDRIRAGAHEYQFVVEELERRPPTGFGPK
jgi:pSer/pThr/pTyr-binding forkhead associated (FHA) protein